MIKKLFLGLTLVASVMLAGVEAKAEISNNRPLPEVASSNSYKFDPSTTNYNVILDGNFDINAATETFNAINEYRVAKLGKGSELDWNEDLAIAAQKRAEEANVYYSHHRTNYGETYFDETLYTGYGNELLKSLKEQADYKIGDNGGHYAHLMDETATECGIGAFKTTDGNFRLAVLTNAEGSLNNRFSVNSFKYTGVDINISWFWGLALQNEYISNDSDTTSNFKAYTKSTKQFMPAILSTDQVTDGSEWNLSFQYSNISYQIPTARYISPSNVTFESLNTDILTIDENGVMQGKKAGTATVRVSLKPQDGVTFKDFTTSSVDYTITVLAGGIEYVSNTANPYDTSLNPIFVPDTTTASANPVIEEQTIQTKTDAATEQQPTKVEKTTEQKAEQVTPVVKTPTKVTGIKVTRNGRKLTIKYNKASNAKKYEIQISTSKKFKSVKSAKTTALKKNITVKASWKKKTLYVRVKAINGTKKGSWSTVKTIKR